jgi:hypothetical protein
LALAGSKVPSVLSRFKWEASDYKSRGFNPEDTLADSPAPFCQLASSAMSGSACWSQWLAAIAKNSSAKKGIF